CRSAAARSSASAGRKTFAESAGADSLVHREDEPRRDKILTQMQIKRTTGGGSNHRPSFVHFRK
ncbi:MAG: hypothetical protein KDI55_29165, partial [Anaerolineae bacterium]|nr:hypothetical protein [Anaerolineae bacterium]